MHAYSLYGIWIFYHSDTSYHFIIWALAIRVFLITESAVTEENKYQHSSKRALDALTETVPNHQKICFWSFRLCPKNMPYHL